LPAAEKVIMHRMKPNLLDAFEGDMGSQKRGCEGVYLMPGGFGAKPAWWYWVVVTLIARKVSEVFDDWVNNKLLQFRVINGPKDVDKLL
jgi:hypothetical protein